MTRPLQNHPDKLVNAGPQGRQATPSRYGRIAIALATALLVLSQPLLAQQAQQAQLTNQVQQPIADADDMDPENPASTTGQFDAPAPDGIRPGGTIAQEPGSPEIAAEVKTMRRPARNYPEQPPVVPHSIRGYQIDKNFNRCLTCHSRSAIVASGAPMISVTHFYDRDGQVLAAVAPRRYFCLQCHVPQHDVVPVRENIFKGIDDVLQEAMVDKSTK